jgi:DNA-binding transcriptional MerR regulator
MTVQLPIHRPGLALVRGPEAVSGPEASAHGDKPLRVGDLARLTGKTVRALHLYEQLELLEPIERSKGGFRLYAGDSVTRVHFIAKLQDLGFSLGDIREIVRSWSASGSAPGAMARMRDLYRAKLEETRAQVERLREPRLPRDLRHLRPESPHRLLLRLRSTRPRRGAPRARRGPLRAVNLRQPLHARAPSPEMP